MEPGREEIVEFRFYEMPIGRYDLAFTGDDWKTTYRAGELHFHNYFEIGYCHEGEGIVYMGKDKPKYTGGMISLIPANFAHAADSIEGGVCFWEWLFVDVIGFLEECYKDEPQYKQQVLEKLTRAPLLISVEEYPALAGVIRAILEENRNPKSLSKEVVNGYLYIFVQELLRLNESIAYTNTEWNLHTDKIRAALIYVDMHYSEEIKIEQLAEVCNISVPYFRKLFVKCMKVTPLEYVNIVRIQKACGFLLKEDIPVNLLAWKVGFTSVSTFERNFKKVVGETPKQWKLKGMGEKEYVTYQTKVLKGWTK
ncbi:MAG: helix-turn-helix transcriptional regulator [Lachnospiraceae bacterium]|nr:helix-turn-helix transcriptional regulator [Lachnospiraceae bacterium]